MRLEQSRRVDMRVRIQKIFLFFLNFAGRDARVSDDTVKLTRFVGSVGSTISYQIRAIIVS